MSTTQIHNLTQGTEAWRDFRVSHYGASDAASMMGVSKYKSRAELVRQYATGIELDTEHLQSIFSKGHEAEEKARAVVEAMIGEDLFPAVYSRGKLSASCDGITMSGELAWEHKLFNQDLFDSVQNGNLPAAYMPQCQQIMLVTGATEVLFVCSDGTAERMASMRVHVDLNYAVELEKGWLQFADDVANYQHIETKPEATGKAPDSLPALRIVVTGMVTASNLAEFKSHALAVFGAIKTDLQTDEDFANADKTAKWCGDVETKLEAAKEHALSQTASIDELFKTIDAIKEEARRVRLDLAKQVMAQKENRRVEIMNKGKKKLADHIAALNNRIGKPYMPVITGNFAEVMKGKKTISSLRDAVDTELARCKIESNVIADKISINLNTLRTLADGYQSLFADTAAIVLKNADDLTALVKTRIADYQAEQAVKAERERIAAEAKKPEPVKRPEQTSKAAVVATVKSVSPVLDALALPNHAQDFEEYWKHDGSNAIEFETKEGEEMAREIARQAFINGYNAGYRHAKDDIAA